jgi:hypothetical protein
MMLPNMKQINILQMTIRQVNIMQVNITKSNIMQANIMEMNIMEVKRCLDDASTHKMTMQHFEPHSTSSQLFVCCDI